MAAPTLTRPSAPTAYVRDRKNTAVIFVPHSPLKDNQALPTGLKTWGLVCTLESMDDLPLSLRNERTISGVFKDDESINDGRQLDEFTLNMFGNATSTIAAFTGQNINAVGSRAFDMKGEYDAVGSLIIISYQKSKTSTSNDTILCSTVVAQVKMRLLSLPGGSDDNLFPVTFYHENPVIKKFGKDVIPVAEVWYDDGTAAYTNTDATASPLNLGNGNNSYSGAITDVDAADIANTATGAERYIIAMFNNAVSQDLTVETYTPAVATTSEGTLTYSNTYASGDYRVVLYTFDKVAAVAGGFTDTTPPNWRTDLLASQAQNVYGGIGQTFHNFVDGPL